MKTYRRQIREKILQALYTIEIRDTDNPEPHSKLAMYYLAEAGTPELFKRGNWGI